MRCRFLPVMTFAVGLVLTLTTQAQEPDPKWAAITLDEARTNPDFELQGEYVGPSVAAQVVAQGKSQFRVVLFKKGLPGADWDRSEPLVEEQDAGEVRETLQTHELKRAERRSPTLGAKPPAGAVVLFDGTPDVFNAHWQTGARMTGDGLLQEGATSTDTFRDFTLHVEFLLPYMPFARGQGRGNSGVYAQGRYETQVLDSFGLEGKNNETGGIYEIRDPDLNMCLPPLTWQTYDVDFTAARFDAEGKKSKNARMTVRLNGIVVQPDVEVERSTRAAPVPEGPEPGPIYLQNHGNPVRFRNIWVRERNADREARRPIVPAFERLHGNGEAPIEAGRLLVGELGCASCHAPGPEFEAALLTKQAPILTTVGERVEAEWMQKFIADPHGIKPGTGMPNRFANWEPAQRDDAVLKLTNFLASTGQLPLRQLDPRLVRKGEKLFHEIGCAICHAPRDGRVVTAATSVPLQSIENKYSIPSLTEFLQNPHAARPSGRMPNLNLQREESAELAHYLLSAAPSRQLPPNVRYAVYHGDWDTLPDLDQLTPVSEGECAGLDIGVAQRNGSFAIRFEGYLHVDRPARYRFFLGSDDGSSLTIDGNKLIDNDGIHPHSESSADMRLEAGVHSVRVDYFEHQGEESLSLEMEFKKTRQDVGLMLTPTEAPLTRQNADTQSGFVFNPDLVAPGRELFQTLGCAGCHELQENGERLRPRPPNGPPRRLAEINVDHPGCLNPQAPVPEGLKVLPADFELSPMQVWAIASFVKSGASQLPAAKDRLHSTMAAFNCYACHTRGGVDGPESSRNPLFTSTIPEMGDEGRVPPPLDGVGDKLREDYLAKVLRDGASERDYMHVRMPKFALQDADQLARSFAEVDQRTETMLATFDDAEHRVKGTGRLLVGEKGLACIKCHTFSRHRATGIQAVSLTNMTSRIRQDWFLRYLYNPAEYRPGTRMPTGFPNGQAAVRDVYEGNASKQLSAVWKYLEEGDKASIPDGLIAEMIELKPTDAPVIYRNFLDGLTPRGIAVGYPEQVNLAWDAGDLCLKKIWHGRFMDASMHWVGRGQGAQSPLGDHILSVEQTVPFAVLDSRDAAWPTESPRQSGWRFKGYVLNEQGQPSFRYNHSGGLSVTDFPLPLAREGGGAIRREFTLSLAQPVESLYFRAAVGNSIKPSTEGVYVVDGALHITVSGSGMPFVREHAGRRELLVPITFAEGIPVKLTQEISW